VVNGLTGSTLITLVLIPVVYSLFHPNLPTPRRYSCFATWLRESVTKKTQGSVLCDISYDFIK
jgi:hypothetical protein